MLSVAVPPGLNCEVTGTRLGVGLKLFATLAQYKVMYKITQLASHKVKTMYTV